MTDTPSTGILRLRSAFRPGRPALVGYVPIGDPDAFDARTLDAYRDAGVAVLEVGIPTRHPWMDGTEVTASMQRALDVGTDARAAATRLAAWRATRQDGDAGPVILWFSYPDLPLDALEAAHALGAIDALLMVEPWRHAEADRLPRLLAGLGIGACSFLPWDPTDGDLRAAAAATGYVMVQARPGPTGEGTGPETPTDQVEFARRLAPGRPVVAGFGIHDARSVRSVLRSGADGVVVGSACIRAAREGGAPGLGAFLRELVDAAAAFGGAGTTPRAGLGMAAGSGMDPGAADVRR